MASRTKQHFETSMENSGPTSIAYQRLSSNMEIITGIIGAQLKSRPDDSLDSMRGSQLYHFDRPQSRIESGFGRMSGLLKATPRNSNLENSEMGDFLGGASNATEFLLPPSFRHGTLFVYARHPEPLSLNIFNNLFFRGFHLISRYPQELYPTAMSQVESYIQQTVRQNTIQAIQSHTDKSISNPRYLFGTSSPQSLAKSPTSPPPPGGPLETSGDGEAH